MSTEQDGTPGPQAPPAREPGTPEPVAPQTGPEPAAAKPAPEQRPAAPEPARPATATTDGPTAEQPALAPPAAQPPAAQPPTEEPPTEEPPATRRGRRWWWVVAAVVAVCLLIAALGLALRLGDADDPDPGEAGPGDITDEDQHIVSGGVEGRDAAELHLVSGANVVTIRAEDLGDTLYQVSTPPDGDAVPRTVERGDRIEVHLAPTGQPGPSSVEIVLSTEVTWTVLRLSGGASEQLLDLTGATVAELDFAAGAARIEATLPVPDGTVPIRLGGGAGQVELVTPAEVPVRVTLTSGAGQVEIDGESHSGITPGTTFTPEDWEQTEARYDLDASGLGELRVSRGEPGPD